MLSRDVVRRRGGRFPCFCRWLTSLWSFNTTTRQPPAETVWKYDPNITNSENRKDVPVNDAGANGLFKHEDECIQVKSNNILLKFWVGYKEMGHWPLKHRIWIKEVYYSNEQTNSTRYIIVNSIYNKISINSHHNGKKGVFYTNYILYTIAICFSIGLFIYILACKLALF